MVSVSRCIFAIGFTLLLAILLTMLPLALWANWYRPCWVALVVIFWCLMLPYRIGVVIPWLIGLLLDIILGTLLGEHALALAVMAYLTIKLQHNIMLFPGWQRWLVILFLLLFYQLMLFLIQGLLGQVPMTWRYWMAPIVSAIIWPIVFFVLSYLQRRFKAVDEMSMRRVTYT